MRQENTRAETKSSVRWETLEEWVREQIPGYLQAVLEEEVPGFLGRQRSERRPAVDAPSGYRNGYGKPRQVTLSCGTVTVRRPRVRETAERFESKVLPVFARQSTRVAALIPDLYLHGLASGDFELALRGL